MEDDAFTSKEWLRLTATVVWLVIFVMWPRPTAAASLLIAGGVMMAFNGMIFWAGIVHKNQTPAVAPIFGGIFAAAGIALLPVDGIWKWAWVPLFLDWGGLPMFVAACYQRIRR